MEYDELYNLDGLIDILEECREQNSGIINWPKACYCLCLEIRKLKEYQEYLHQLVPMKYKKIMPSEGENPFFSTNQFKIPENKQELERAKKRMHDLSKGSSQ